MDLLIRLKETKYGNYIQNETRVLELTKQENAKHDRYVSFKSKGFALSPIGEKKEKCMIGEKADCENADASFRITFIGEVNGPKS
ncbi:MAG: hypothetical protein R2877_02055 [Bdellovibrionota bacterium]